MAAPFQHKVYATNYMYVYTVCYHFLCTLQCGFTILYIVTRLLFSHFWGCVWWISEICNYLSSHLYTYWSTFLGWRWAALICPFGGFFVRHLLVFINWYMLMLVIKIHVHSYNVFEIIIRHFNKMTFTTNTELCCSLL